MTVAVRTTCPYCGVGCGVLATPDGQGGASIAGDPDHPANFGRLCSKGSALGETLGLATRLLHPSIRGARVSWDAALDHVATGFRDIIERHGPSAVGFYLSGQLLTEDYYVPNKLMKGFIGSANVDTNSRLCMSSSVAGHKRAFGSDTVPGCYEDLDEADLFVLVGSNAAWCHPVLYQRMIKAQETRDAAIVTIDVRTTATGENATMQLSIAPGQDAALFSGLLVYLADNDHLDRAYVAAHTEGFEAALERARAIAPNVAATALRTRLRPDDIARFFRRFATTEKVVTLYSQGVNQSSQGTDKVNAILNCHLATGRIGRPGMGPFSLTGQPNAMGGREVGGLANQLAAHMGFTPADVDRVGRFWNAPNMARKPGLMINEMIKAIEAGSLKALWVLGTNPAVSLPQAADARAAFKRLDLFVVSENVASNDTVNVGAHVVLPSMGWGEKDGTVTNSERRISRQRRFLPPPGEAREDWWMVSQVARKLGFSGFDYSSAADIFAEHAALSAFENDGRRDFEIGGLSSMDSGAYDDLKPIQWPVPGDRATVRPRLFGDGGFFTPSGKAIFVAVEPPRLAESVSTSFPLLMNTGRVRDQWHTMTRTGLSPRLGSHVTEPFVAIHPRDAARFGLTDGGLARLSNHHGAGTYRVVATPNQARGAVFVPMHWNDETASDARTGSLVHAIVDPLSGQPDSKATPVAIEPVAVQAAGFMLARRRVMLPRDSYWAWSAIGDGYAARIDTSGDGGDLLDALRVACGPADILRYEDKRRDLLRTALMAGDRLVGALFLAPAALAPKWSLLADAWAADAIDQPLRRVMLSGKTLDGAVDEGPNVCACFGVPQGRIVAAIQAGASSPAAIGAKLKAGTNCGSCIPELKRLVAAADASAKKQGVS